MTSDRLNIPGLNDDEQEWFDVLWARLKARRPTNLLRASYYDGKRAARALSAIAQHYQNLGAVLGWNAKAVDMLGRRCNPEGFYWPDGDL
ncbi:MAG TPA: portal protein, partial [Coriobacteriia bacterium]|nr:portal protein [Coriobacteriia bacterium]